MYLNLIKFSRIPIYPRLVLHPEQASSRQFIGFADKIYNWKIIGKMHV